MKKRIILLASGVLAFIFVVSICLLHMEKKPTWQEQYDLGIRYLSVGNYQEAIIAFTAAIEIDPMRPETYLKAAEAYEAVGDYESAREILERGYAMTGDESLKPKTEPSVTVENVEEISTDGEFYGKEPTYDLNYGCTKSFWPGGTVYAVNSFVSSTGTYLFDNGSLYRESESGFDEIELIDCRPDYNIAFSGNWFYFTERDETEDLTNYLTRYNLLTKEKQTLFEHSDKSPEWFTIYNDHIYFVKYSTKIYINDTKELWRCELDGSNIEMLLETERIVDYIDFFEDNLYFLDSESDGEKRYGLWRAGLDGTNPTLILPLESRATFSIYNGKIYLAIGENWFLNSGYSTVYSCNPDGSDLQFLFQEGIQNEMIADIYGLYPTSNGIYYLVGTVLQEDRDSLLPSYFKFWSTTGEIKDYGRAKNIIEKESDGNIAPYIVETERYIYFYVDMWTRGMWYDEDYAYGGTYKRFDKLSGTVYELVLPHEYYYD